MEHGRRRPCFFLLSITFIAKNAAWGQPPSCPVERS